jgi:hypothetical protein
LGYGEPERAHRISPSGIAWVEVTYDEESLRTWLGDDVDVPLRFVDGPARLSAVAISTEAGEIVLR